MRRGQFVVVATAGDYGKPRPALVVQSDLFTELPSVVICPLTATLRDDADQFRIEVDPSKRNGLCEVSQIAIDKITVVPVAKIGGVIGEGGDALLLRVNRALALFLGIVWRTGVPAAMAADLVLAGRAFPADRVRIADRGLREGMLLQLIRADRAPA